MLTCLIPAQCNGRQASSAHLDFYSADRQGNVLAVTRRGADQLMQRFFYTPFGVEMQGDPTGNPFRYTGRYYDAETGLYYYRARYYDADLGRFLSVDPIGYADQWNLYAYVGNSPLMYTDPTGENAVAAGIGCAVTGPACPVGAAVGFAVGAAATAACLAWCDDAANSIMAMASRPNRITNVEGAVATGVEGARRQHSYVVRVQLQGRRVGENSVVLAGSQPIPADQVRGALTALQGTQGRRNLRDSAPAFAAARRTVSNYEASGVPAGFSRSHNSPGVTGNQIRVDIESLAGRGNIVSRRGGSGAGRGGGGGNIGGTVGERATRLDDGI